MVVREPKTQNLNVDSDISSQDYEHEYLSSRRASAQAVTSKWQLRTTSPMNTNSSAGENGFPAKNGS